MARDIGGALHEVDVSSEPPTAQSLAFAPGVPFGAGLRAAREFYGYAIEDIADYTKIRPAYLAALEAMALDQLPSRPFAIGYVRAYAQALGLDEEAAIARFKHDAPEKAQPLRAPIGVPKEKDPRFAMVVVGLGIVLAAIVIWNVAQRAMRNHEAPAATVAAAPPPTTPAAPAGPVKLGQALPPPLEATIPDPYVTPGLPGAAPATAPVAPTAPRQLGAKAAVYGAAANEPSTVTLQAARSVTMVIKGADGKPYFARQLTAGESYRAPDLAGLSVDVSPPDAIAAFDAGQYKGALTQPVTPLSSLMR